MKSILDNCGLSNIWNLSDNLNVHWLKMKVQHTLEDQFKQRWARDLQDNSKAIGYRLFKRELMFEDYLVKLTDFQRTVLCRFRVGSSKLPVERGYQNIERNRRFCNLCDNNSIGDEFHLLLECDNPHIKRLRGKYLPRYCQSGANVIKFLVF